MRGCFDIVRIVVLMAHACMIRWLCQLSPRSEGAAYSMRADRVRQIVRKTYMFFVRELDGVYSCFGRRLAMSSIAQPVPEMRPRAPHARQATC